MVIKKNSDIVCELFTSLNVRTSRGSPTEIGLSIKKLCGRFTFSKFIFESPTEQKKFEI